MYILQNGKFVFLFVYEMLCKIYKINCKFLLLFIIYQDKEEVVGEMVKYSFKKIFLKVVYIR